MTKEEFFEEFKRISCEFEIDYVNRIRHKESKLCPLVEVNNRKFPDKLVVHDRYWVEACRNLKIDPETAKRIVSISDGICAMTDLELRSGFINCTRGK